MRRQHLEKNVYEALQERLHFIFQEFDNIFVSFSGGKDSGLLLNLVIYVLSRFIEVMVPHVTHENGETWYTYSSSITARSYKYFVQEYKLELLVALFWILTAAGLVIAFVPKEKLARTAEKLQGLWKRMQKEVERF